MCAASGARQAAVQVSLGQIPPQSWLQEQSCVTSVPPRHVFKPPVEQVHSCRSERQLAVEPNIVWAWSRHVQSCVVARHRDGSPVALQEQACFFARQVPGFFVSTQRQTCFRAWALQLPGDVSHVHTWAASVARQFDGPSAPLHEHSCVAARHAVVLDVAGVSDRLPAATPAARPIGPATSKPATPTAAVAA